jgi:hypothetical protein
MEKVIITNKTVELVRVEYLLFGYSDGVEVTCEVPYVLQISHEISY